VSEHYCIRLKNDFYFDLLFKRITDEF